MRASFQEVSLPVGRILFEAGDKVDQIYFPSSGVVSIVTAMRDGEVVESLTVGREGAVGLVCALGDHTSDPRAVVQIAGSALRIGAERLRAASHRHPGIADVALRYAQTMIAQLHRSAACNALHGVEARLCRWLLTCEDRVGDAVLPLTQEFLATMLGVQRTSVTFAAQALQRKGLITYSRGRITILDRDGLMHASCECYEDTEATYDRIFGLRSDAA